MNFFSKKKVIVFSLLFIVFLSGCSLFLSDAEKLHNKGKEYLKSNENGKAINMLTQAIELDDKNAAIFLNRAIAYKNTGLIEDSIKDLNKVIDLDNNVVEAYVLRANCYYVLQDFGKAMIDVNRALDLTPDDSSLYILRATFFNAKKDFENALADTDKAMQFSDFSNEVYIVRAITYVNLKETDKAILELNKLLDSKQDENSGTLVNAYLLKAQIYYMKDNFEEAIANADMAINIQKENYNLYLWKAKSLEKTGKNEEALSVYKEAIKYLDKTSIEGKNIMNKIDELEKK